MNRLLGNPPPVSRRSNAIEERAALSELHQRTLARYEATSEESNVLETRRDRDFMMRKYQLIDVEDCERALAAATDPSDIANLEGKLEKELARLTEANADARQAEEMFLQGLADELEQRFIVDVLENQLDAMPLGRYARRREQMRLQRGGAPPPPRATIQQIQQVYQWRLETEDCFRNYSAMTRFPSPPEIVACSDQTCENRPFGCRCNIKACFRTVPNFDADRERGRWHPDNFLDCEERYRNRFRSMGDTIFTVLHNMHLNETDAMDIEILIERQSR